MSLASALINSYPLPEGAVAVGEVRHPADAAGYTDEEWAELAMLGRLPVIRTRTGAEVQWDGKTMRNLPRDWRNALGAVEYGGDQ